MLGQWWKDLDKCNVGSSPLSARSPDIDFVLHRFMALSLGCCPATAALHAKVCYALQGLDGGYERPVVVTAFASTLPVTIGGDGCRAVPLERWDADAYRSGANRLETRFGAFLSAADSFDAAAFSVSRQATYQH